MPGKGEQNNTVQQWTRAGATDTGRARLSSDEHDWKCSVRGQCFSFCFTSKHMHSWGIAAAKKIAICYLRFTK